MGRDRFAFGRNWREFLVSLDEGRIRRAEETLEGMLGTPLKGKSFLDVGSGSGLFSLAARRLGATVRSFDYDVDSVACTESLRQRFFPDDPSWRVEQGSALDQTYLATLGTFDVVYSWGVLHHTGSMMEAFANVAPLVGPGGLLFIAIYNDQGSKSRAWKRIKRLYNKLPGPTKLFLSVPYFLTWWGVKSTGDLIRLQPFRSYRNYKEERGMSPWYDAVDWVGGYPFEVAKPEVVFEFFQARSFVLEKLLTRGAKLGCNEYVFRRSEQETH
jgi:2-polyprenyl-6-hydroxyphenyl methylase/3-demethylubiquinone-9 3-methyltransferase